MLYAADIRRPRDAEATRWYFDDEWQRRLATRLALGAGCEVSIPGDDYITSADEVLRWISE